MAKKKSTKSTTKTTTTATTETTEVKTEETPVEITTTVESEPVESTTEVDTTSTTDNTTVEDAEVVKTETPVEGAKVETTEEPVTEENKEEVEPLPEDKQITPVTESKVVLGSAKKEIKGSSDDVQKELATKYKVKFAQSYFMKMCAATKQFSLFSIIETWMINRNAFIGLTSLDDFNHIKEVVEGNIITYKYKVLSAEVKKAFLDKLEFNTQYVVSHK